MLCFLQARAQLALQAVRDLKRAQNILKVLQNNTKRMLDCEKSLSNVVSNWKVVKGVTGDHARV